MASCNVGLSALCNIMERKDQLQLFMASDEDVKDIFKGQILKEPKLLQFDSGFCKWFTTMHCKEHLRLSQ